MEDVEDGDEGGGQPIECPETITDPTGGIARDLVEQRFTEAQSYGSEMWGLTLEYLSELLGREYDLSWEMPEWEDIETPILDGVEADKPEDLDLGDPIEANLPTPGFSPDEMDAYEIQDRSDLIPVFDIPDPGITIPPAPSDQFPKLTEDPPVVNDPKIPEVPPYTLPSGPPEIAPIVIPGPPEFDFSGFTGEEPVFDLEPPSPMFVWNEAEYDSDLKRQLAENLLRDLVNGGSGLPVATEQAIYDRATARQEIENEKLYTEALSFFSSRGFRLPPGALAGRLQEASYKITRVRTDLNNDILVQQSKLAQENTHFIIDRSIQYEKNLMDYANQYQQRAFEAAKYTVESAIIVYRAKLETYQARVEVYKVLAQVYDIKIRAEATKAQVYKTIVDAKGVEAQVQKLYLEAYLAQIESVRALIELYKAEMEAAKIRVTIDQLYADRYRAIVEAYKAQVGAVTSIYEAYQAKVAAEKVKADVYKTRVEAYQSRAETFKAVTQGDALKIDSIVNVLKGKLERFNALLARHQSLVDSSKFGVEVELKDRDGRIKKYEEEVKRYQHQLRSLNEAYTDKVKEALAKTNHQKEKETFAWNEMVKKYEFKDNATAVLAKIAAQLGAAAISMVSASAALGYHEGKSDSTNQSCGVTNSSVISSSVSVATINTHSS